MNKYVKILKRHIAENPPNYGDGDASAILDMLYCYYHECNNTDDDNVKAAFEDLYQQMHSMPLREIDRISMLFALSAGNMSGLDLQRE